MASSKTKNRGLKLDIAVCGIDMSRSDPPSPPPGPPPSPSRALSDRA